MRKKIWLYAKSIIQKCLSLNDISDTFYHTYKKYHLKNRSTNLKNQYYFNKFYKKYHCHVGLDAQIGEGTKFPHPIGIVIGQNVVIGTNCTIYQNVTIGRRDVNNPQDVPIIGNNVLIGCNSIILGNVEVGNNAKIAAGSIVLRNIKPNETVSGIVK